MISLTVPRALALEKLQGLIALNIDCAKEYRRTAARVQNLVIMQVFRVAAGAREIFVEQLQEIVGASGAEPVASGTVAGALHRSWSALAGAVGNERDERELLGAAERSEEHVSRHYEEALDEPLDEVVAEVLRQQLKSVKKFQDKVRGLLSDLYAAPVTHRN